MRKLLIASALIISLYSCKRTDKALLERVNTSDSVAINYFKGDGSMDTVVAVKLIKDKAIIHQLATLVSAAATSPEEKCGMDGSIHFFKNDAVIQDVYFRNAANCSQFSYSYQGEKKACSFSDEAKALLDKIRH